MLGITQDYKNYCMEKDEKKRIKEMLTYGYQGCISCFSYLATQKSFLYRLSMLVRGFNMYNDDDDNKFLFVDRLTSERHLYLISSWDHCQKFSPLQISDILPAEFQLAQNLSSEFFEWSCAIMIATNHCINPNLFIECLQQQSWRVWP